MRFYFTIQQSCIFNQQKEIIKIFNIIRRYMRAKKLSWMVLTFLFLFHFVQPDEIKSLQLNQIYQLHLNGQTSMKYEITIPESLQPDQNLYITGYSTFNRPNEYPNLQITTQGYQLKCQVQQKTLNDVCFVPYNKLKAGLKFTIQATCELQCESRLVTYLSKTVQLDLNQEVQVSTQDSPTETLFKIIIPSNFNYTEIDLLISLQNSYDVKGFNIFVKASPTFVKPSESLRQYVHLVNWGLKQAIVLSKNVHYKPGDSLYVLLAVQPNTILTFQSRYGNTETRYLSLNQGFYDYIYYPITNRTYILDLDALAINNQFSNPIIIEIYEYSGSPKIQLSLDEKFTHEEIIKPSTHSTRLRFQISPEEIKSSSKKTIFLRISSVWGSTYEILSREKLGDFDQIYSGETQYIEVKPNDVGLAYYKFETQIENATQLKTINVRIQNEGQYQQVFKAYNCKQSSSKQCKYNKNSQNSNLKSLTTIKNSFDYEINYLPSDCQYFQGSNFHFCTFVFVLESENIELGGRYALTVEKQSFAILLQQRKGYQGSVEKQQYAYFMFFLPGPSYQEKDTVLSLSFLVTTLDGNLNLYSSIHVNFPTQQHKSNPTVKQSVNLITYQRYQIKGGVNYYLTIYGVQYSDFVVNVLVRRSGNTPQFNSIQMNSKEILGQSVKSTQIQLSDGVAQTFSLPYGYDKIQFRFQAFSDSPITLIVHQLEGSVQTSVVDEKTHTNLQCITNQCSFDAKTGDKFFVTINGKLYQSQTFTIVYKQVKPCYKYPVGTPIFVSLDRQEDACIDFIFQPDHPIQISNSLTNLQLLDKDVDIVINFIESNKSILMSSNSYIFQASDLKSYCLPQQISACNVEIKFISFDYPIELQFVIQRIDGLITLYDGVSQRMDTVISKYDSKHFRIPLNSIETVEIFLMSQTSSEYVISAKVLAGPQSSSINKFPDAIEESQSVWRSSTTQDFSSLTTLTISKSKLSTIISGGNILNPWLAISIFGKGEQYQHVSFNIEVTQKERMLRQGEQQIGFLQPNQIVSYQIYPSVVSLLSVRSLYNKKCFTILDQNDKQLENQEIFIEQPRKIPLVYKIKSTQFQKCMYQISLQDYENSVLTIAEGFSTRVILQYQEKTFFMYYHNKNQSFRIFQFVQTGSSSLYATPLLGDKDVGKGISDIVDDSRLSSFIYKSQKVNNLQIEAKQSNSQYCFNCYYLIAIKGTPAVHEEIVIVKQSNPVILREHALVDSYLDAGEVERFIYYSGNYAQFNLSIDAIYGRVTVRVKKYDKNPQGQLLKIQTVQKTAVNLQIAKGSQQNGGLGLFTPDISSTLDEQNKYVIQVQGMSKLALYHLQVLKYSDSFRIVQGLSSKVTIPAGGFLDIQFDNLIEQGKLQFDISPLTSQIMPQVFYRQPGLPKDKSLLINFGGYTRIGKVGSIYFAGTRGHFTFKLQNTAWGPVDVVVQIPKPGITEFRQQYTLISQRQNIFEIYIPQNSYAIIQLYVCQGNVKVRGSSQLKDVERSTPKRSETLLTHQNIGGHFVITTPENVTGQYFLRVQNKEFKAMISAGVSGIKYLINYRIHENKHKNPYSLLEVQSYSLKIFRSQEKQNITIALSKIKSTSPEMKVKSIKYIFSIGKSYDQVKQFLTCQTSDPKHLSFLVVNDDSFDQVYLNISKHTILQRIGANQDSYIGALALALVQYDGGAKYSDNIVYIYQPSFLSGIQTTKILTTVGFFEIMVIIFTVVGGVIVCYALAIYFIRVYRGYSNTNELIQQQSKQQSDQIKFEVSSQKVEEPKIEQELKQSEERKESD